MYLRLAIAANVLYVVTHSEVDELKAIKKVYSKTKL